MSVHNLTDEEISDIFYDHDHDGSGKLNITELGDALNKLGIDLTEHELADTYRIDDNPDFMTLDEFTTYIRERIANMEPDFQKRCEMSLKMFDEEGTGYISRDKMKEILTQLGSVPLDEEEAEAMLDEFDKNKDGVFDIHEIVDLLYNL